MKQRLEVLASLEQFGLDETGRHSNFNTTRDLSGSVPPDCEWRITAPRASQGKRKRARKRLLRMPSAE